MGAASEPAHCRRCGHAFTSRMKVEDLIAVERALGFAYETPGNPIEHYQWICPPCRRAALALAQGILWQGRRGGAPLPAGGEPIPMPVPANPGIDEGPLGPRTPGTSIPSRSSA
jgi:hypothetical protein